MPNTSAVIALPVQETDITNTFPIMDYEDFRKEVGNFVGKVFHCPDCKEYYCIGEDQVDAYCEGCHYTKFFKDACLKRSSAMLFSHETPQTPIQKACFKCHYSSLNVFTNSSKEKKSKTKVIDLAKERRKRKRKKASLQERREKKRQYKLQKQQHKILTLLLSLKLEPEKIHELLQKQERKISTLLLGLKLEPEEINELLEKQQRKILTMLLGLKLEPEEIHTLAKIAHQAKKRKSKRDHNTMRQIKLFKKRSPAIRRVS